jgi:hypothetical protein
MKQDRPGRRTFIRTSAGTAAGLTLSSVLPRGILGANDRLRVGLIGCGGRGNYLLGETLKIAASHNVEVAALCDVWKVNLEKTAARLAGEQATKPRTFARFMDLLSMPGLDAVLIATPDFAHTPILIEATRLKKDAFVEKPMATVLDHANTAVDLVKQNRTIVQVGCQRRSDPRHQEGARLIQSGILGKVSEVEAAWHDAAPRWARDYSDACGGGTSTRTSRWARPDSWGPTSSTSPYGSWTIRSRPPPSPTEASTCGRTGASTPTPSTA